MSNKISEKEVLEKRIEKLEEDISWLLANPAREYHYVEAGDSELRRYQARQTVARENATTEKVIDRKYK